jgi:hypothetical protein
LDKEKMEYKNLNGGQVSDKIERQQNEKQNKL